jgi:hypothetical protein
MIVKNHNFSVKIRANIESQPFFIEFLACLCLKNLGIRKNKFRFRLTLSLISRYISYRPKYIQIAIFANFERINDKSYTEIGLNLGYFLGLFQYKYVPHQTIKIKLDHQMSHRA